MFSVGAFLFTACALAGPSVRKTKITFNQSVRVPGATLTAGTYYFQAPEFNNRTLVRINDKDGKRVAQFVGVRERVRKGDHDVIVFGEHECEPRAIKSWFYPGGGIVRFVYPKDEAVSIAKACNEPVPAIHENSLDDSQFRTANLYLVTPQGEETSYKSEALLVADQEDKNGFDSDAN